MRFERNGLGTFEGWHMDGGVGFVLGNIQYKHLL